MWYVILSLCLCVFLMFPFVIKLKLLVMFEGFRYEYKIKSVFAFCGGGELGEKNGGNVKTEKTLKKAFELVFVKKMESRLFLPVENLSSASVFGAMYGLFSDTLFAYLERRCKTGEFKREIFVEEEALSRLELDGEIVFFGFELVALAAIFVAENVAKKKEGKNGERAKQ